MLQLTCIYIGQGQTLLVQDRCYISNYDPLSKIDVQILTSHNNYISSGLQDHFHAILGAEGNVNSISLVGCNNTNIDKRQTAETCFLCSGGVKLKFAVVL